MNRILLLLLFFARLCLSFCFCLSALFLSFSSPLVHSVCLPTLLLPLTSPPPPPPLPNKHIKQHFCLRISFHHVGYFSCPHKPCLSSSLSGVNVSYSRFFGHRVGLEFLRGGFAGRHYFSIRTMTSTSEKSTDTKDIK